MIARKTKLKLLAFATLAVLGMAYLGFKYVGLDRVILGSGYDVAADFTDSGGIFVNAEVTYRGVAVGRVTDMQLVDDGVRVALTIDPDADPIPADTEACRHPQRGGGAVRRPAAGTATGEPVPRGRLGHPGENDRDPGAGRADAAQHRRARRVDRPGEPADRRRRAGPGLRRRRRRPRPAHRQRRPAARPRRGVAAADPRADHRRADRARRRRWRAARRSSSGRRTCGWSPTPSSTWTRPARAAGQRARRGRGRSSTWWRTPAGPGLAGPQPRHPQPGHDPAARRRRADAGHLPGRRLRRVHRGPAGRRRRDALALRLRAERRRPARLHDRLRPDRRSCPAQGAVETPTSTRVECRVVNGVRPEPRGRPRRERLEHPWRAEHRPGRRHGHRPAAGPRRRAAAGRPRVLDEVLGGLLARQPVRSHVAGDPAVPTAPTTRRQGESPG